jgi:hypothetical protein
METPDHIIANHPSSRPDPSPQLGQARLALRDAVRRRRWRAVPDRLWRVVATRLTEGTVCRAQRRPGRR